VFSPEFWQYEGELMKDKRSSRKSFRYLRGKVGDEMG
jgi:hypothetical protein